MNPRNDNYKDEVIVILVAMMYGSLKELDKDTDRGKIQVNLRNTLARFSNSMENHPMLSSLYHNLSCKIHDRMSATKTPQEAFEDIITYKPNWFMRFIYQLLELCKFKKHDAFKFVSSLDVSKLQQLGEKRQFDKDKNTKYQQVLKENKISEVSLKDYNNLSYEQKIKLFKDGLKLHCNLETNIQASQVLEDIILKIKIAAALNKLNKSNGSSNEWEIFTQEEQLITLNK